MQFFGDSDETAKLDELEHGSSLSDRPLPNKRGAPGVR